MAHLIDTTTGKAAIAYAGQTPWHGLGAKLEAAASIADWTSAAGLSYEVMRSKVQFENERLGELKEFADRHVLYRSDTNKPLSVVSKEYKVVQPSEVMEFFGQLVDLGGFQMETAGALSDGRRIWALAKINDGAPVLGNDTVRPFVLLTTSYDGTMATTGKLTAIRVVCNNTLSAAVTGARSEIKVAHNLKFDADKMRTDLGIYQNTFEKWLIQTRRLAEKQLSAEQVEKLTSELITPTMRSAAEGGPAVASQTKGYQRIMELFEGGALGADMAGQTAWGWVNAVTQFVDHERGKAGASRLNSAWFGPGNQLKSKAYDLAMRDLLEA